MGETTSRRNVMTSKVYIFIFGQFLGPLRAWFWSVFLEIWYKYTYHVEASIFAI